MNLRLSAVILVAVLLLLASCTSESGHATPTTTSRTTTTVQAVTVPNVVGMTALAAEVALVRAHLGVSISESGNRAITVQRPAAGTRLPVKSIVNISACANKSLECPRVEGLLPTTPNRAP